MLLFAQLDDNNYVLNVVAVDDDVCSTPMDPAGEVYCQNLFGGGNWKQSSQTGEFRKRNARKLGSYDPVNDVFIDEKPFASWVLDADFAWEAPVAYPSSSTYNSIDVVNIHWDENSWDASNHGWLGMTRPTEAGVKTDLVWNAGTSAWDAA